MSQPESGSSRSRQILSALADGEATDLEGADAFLAWREDAEVRATWHCYHLIGDVMRSDDLATPAAGQQRLLAALRERLVQEPVVLAPQALPEPPLPVARPAPPAVANAAAGGWLRSHWQAPVALTAGFLAMLGGLQVLRSTGGPEAGRATLAQAGAASVVAVAALPSAPAAARMQTAAALARDQAEQIAPYVAAHRLSTMNAALQMPGGADIRNVALVQPAQ
jgi:sigma-E factor negative regulatory protein RseA